MIRLSPNFVKLKIHFFVKIRYVVQIEEVRLSLKEKALVLDRDRNFDSIVIKLGTHVGLIKIQIYFVDELCGANRSCRTFLRRKIFDTH